MMMIQKTDSLSLFCVLTVLCVKDIPAESIASFGAGNTTVVPRTTIGHFFKSDESAMPQSNGVEIEIERVLGQGCSAVPWPSCRPSNASISIGEAPRKTG